MIGLGVCAGALATVTDWPGGGGAALIPPAGGRGAGSGVTGLRSLLQLTAGLFKLYRRRASWQEETPEKTRGPGVDPDQD
jgi:hypothetical protein